MWQCGGILVVVAEGLWSWDAWGDGGGILREYNKFDIFCIPCNIEYIALKELW